MIGTSLPEYVFIRGCIWALRAVLPASAAYLAARALTRLPSPLLALDCYAGAELLFYLAVYLPFRRNAQLAAEHPALLPPEERRELLQRCIDNIDSFPDYLAKWFKDAAPEDVKRDNVREYLSWAFFNTDREDADHTQEIDSYLDMIESAGGTPIAPGRGPAQCLRLTLDPVSMLHRPLLWYMIVFGIDMLTHVLLLSSGYSFYRPAAVGAAFRTTFPPRPQLFLTRHRSPSRQLAYWYHPHTSKTELPVLFLHGIGIGALSYVAYLRALNAGRDASDQIGVLVVEMMPISFRLTPLMMPGPAFAAQVDAILEQHAIRKCILVGHSYGTAMTPHILRYSESASRVAGCVLVDPVSIMLHRPAVAYNFVHRTPRGANEWQLYYFASTDPGVARTLGRTFFWSQKILWKHDWAPRPLTAVLGARDLIVDTPCVASYLTDGAWRGGSGAEPVEFWDSQSPQGQGDVRIMWSARLDHAQVFDEHPHRDILVRETLRLARRCCDEAGDTTSRSSSGSRKAHSD